jgi:ElaB/YqjD/DUF883 family membrane-anchored ribosome-binding protein
MRKWILAFFTKYFSKEVADLKALKARVETYLSNEETNADLAAKKLKTDIESLWARFLLKLPTEAGLDADVTAAKAEVIKLTSDAVNEAKAASNAIQTDFKEILEKAESVFKKV